MKKYMYVVLFAAMAVFFGAEVVLAEGGEASSSLTPIGIGLTMGVAALGGTLSQGKAITAALEAIGRNPSASGEVFLPLILGLAFVESLVILSFVIAFGM